MRMMRLVSLVVLLSSLSLGASAEFNPLLPRPQEIHYGSGWLRVRGVRVHLPPGSTEEDRFAAQTLAQFLSDRAKGAMEISEGDASEPAIVLIRSGAVDPLPVPDERPGPESREAYWLKVTPRGAEIRAVSSAGLFYGVQTLCQLVEGSAEEAKLPEVEIHDWPALAYRGTMVDISQGPLPTELEIKRQIDFLARWKANQYYLFNEGNIELDGYPLLNPEGRLTKEEVRRIVDYGRQRHIDVIPCLELYGHMHDLFRVELHSDLGAIIPHGDEFDPRNPNVKAVLNDWIDQFSRLFPSRFVHVGFDEPWLIEQVAKQHGTTPAKLYVEHLSYVAKLFEQRGKRVMAWGDIMVKYPEILSELPPGMMAVPWYYDAKPDREYKQWLGPLVAHNVPRFIAPGVDSSTELTPDFVQTFENIDTFLAAGRKSSGLLGLINTVWGDDSELLMRMSWPGMAYGAAAPWQSRPMDQGRFFSDYAGIMYAPLIAPEVAAALENLTEAEANLQKVLGHDTIFPFWAGDPFGPENLKNAAIHREDLRRVRILAEEAQTHLYRALSLGGDPTTLSSLLFGSRFLDYAGLRNLYPLEIVALWQRLGPRPSADQFWRQFGDLVIYQVHGRISDLMYGITELREAYRSAWLAEYSPYRLAAALGRWDAEYEYWRRLQQRFEVFSENIHDGDTLPPLDRFTEGK